MKKTVSLVLFAVVVAAAAGCKKSSNPVLAKAGSVKITQEDFSKEVSNSPPVYQNYLSTLEGKKQFIDILLKEKILVNAAEKSDVAKKPDFKKSIEDYDKRLKEQAAEYRKGLLLREYLRELKDTELKVSEEDIRAYYDQNRDNYENPRKIVASHILCLTESDAQAALQRVKKGEDFKKVAREVSRDPTAERGGLIGEVMRGDLSDLPEFETELFSLKSGQVSSVVKTKLGFHVIKNNGESRMRGQSADEAAPQIRRVLEKKKFDGWIEKAKKDQKVWVDEKALSSVALPSAGRGAAEPEGFAPQQSVR
jgi:parvulin-like peptidyl-prolyl isomerase